MESLKNTLRDSAVESWLRHPLARAVEEQRRLYLDAHSALGGTAPNDDQSIADACLGSKSHLNCLRLCQLASVYGDGGIIELGTNIGISSAYLAIGAGNGGLPTLCSADQSVVRLSIANRMHAEVGILGVCLHLGTFDEALPLMLQHTQRPGLVFIDGDHTHDGTIRYWRRLREHMPAASVAVFDDIEWNDEMRQAWAAVSTDERATEILAIDGMGYIRLG